MNDKKNIPGFLLSAIAAIIFLLPASTFALTDLEKSQNEKTALELELQRKDGEVEAKIKELEAETQKKQEEINAQLTNKEKELTAVKAEADAAKKEAETAKKDADTAKKEIDTAKKETEAAKKNAETAKKESDTAKQNAEAAKKSAADKEKALQDRIKELETQLQNQSKEQTQSVQNTNQDPNQQPNQNAAGSTDLEKQLQKAKDDAAAREKELLARIQELESQKSQDGLQNKTDSQNNMANIDKNMDEQRYKEKIAALEAAIEDLNAQLEECKDRVRTQTEKINNLESQKKDFQKELNGEIKNGNVRMPDLKDKKMIVINIDDRISFDPGSATLKRNVFPALDKIAKVLKNYPEHKILVAGHTDSDQIARAHFKDNKELSEARANAVLDYLLKNTDLDKSQFRARGFGETRPIARNNTPANKALNRRVDIIVVTAENDMPEEVPEETEEDDTEE